VDGSQAHRSSAPMIKPRAVSPDPRTPIGSLLVLSPVHVRRSVVFLPSHSLQTHMKHSIPTLPRLQASTNQVPSITLRSKQRSLSSVSARSSKG
jgi:hypothetical protein